MSLWTRAQAVEATGGVAQGSWAVDGISIDTRTIDAGDLFVALKDVRDGHDFVAAAFEAGAGAAMVSRVPDGLPSDAPLLIVDDVLTALERLAVAARARTGAKVVGVTGSVGKTSTKEMLRDVLSAQGRTHASVASYNNHWGVPLTLARMPADTQFAVIEMGMNHPGEIAPLSKLTRPHVAMVTTVAPAHLEAFENIEGIAREKASITDGLVAGGVAVLNADIATSEILQNHALKSGCEMRLFGEMSSAYQLRSARVLNDLTIVEARIETDTGAEDILFKVMSAGTHFAVNALGALAVVDALGGDLGRAAIDMARWQPPSGRGMRERIVLDVVETDAVIDLIDDAYNANPASLAAALAVLSSAEPQDNLGRVSSGRRIAILGDMLELGSDEMAIHASVAQDSNLAAASKVHCVGPRMKALYDALGAPQRGRWYETAQELAAEVSHIVDAGDVVLVKGSLGSGVTQVVDALRKLGQSTTSTT